MTRLLIVNADDYGLTRGVSRGILRAHREGIVTSVSMLAVAPDFDAAAAGLRAEGAGMGVGVHLAAVGEDPPLLDAARIPTLLESGGRLPPSWKRFLRRAHRVSPRELDAEFSAQIERVLAAGIAIDHLDAHQHLHLLPRVRGVVLSLAKRFRIPAVRVPHAGVRRPAGLAVRWLARGLGRAAGRAGLVAPDRSDGFDDSGRMSRRALLLAIERAARSEAASAEILLHPGEARDPERGRYAWGYDWGGELEAAIDPEARAAILRAGFRLGTYRDLPWGSR
ncbi:MAG: ChbG/HpnK family deacetylase [Acidobacteria bacterium]|nr:ChbG/HpnK family deacetylase [Acidobacteriota bacterium]